MFVLGALGVLLVLFLIGSAINYDAARRTPQAVERIHARTVTLEMVSGRNLPPMPLEPDSTIAGVDANANGVRDDVELAIFAAHSNEPKVRAGQLQYALSMQSWLTDVFSEETLVAAIQEEGRAFLCLSDSQPMQRGGLPVDRLAHEWTPEEVALGNRYSEEHGKKVESLVTEVEEWVLNTQARQERYDDGYRFMTSYSGSSKPHDCDVDLEQL